MSESKLSWDNNIVMAAGAIGTCRTSPLWWCFVYRLFFYGHCRDNGGPVFGVVTIFLFLAYNQLIALEFFNFYAIN